MLRNNNCESRSCRSLVPSLVVIELFRTKKVYTRLLLAEHNIYTSIIKEKEQNHGENTLIMHIASCLYPPSTNRFLDARSCVRPEHTASASLYYTKNNKKNKHLANIHPKAQNTTHRN